MSLFDLPNSDSRDSCAIAQEGRREARAAEYRILHLVSVCLGFIVDPCRAIPSWEGEEGEGGSAVSRW